ncbi:MAG: hotdog fold thioesterase [Pseudomonadota bacterium]
MSNNASSIWFTEPSLDAIVYANDQSLVTTLDITLTEIGPDYLRGTMPVTPRVHQPMGILHGGASVALAETLGSVAASLTLDLSRQMPVGLEINANHVRPVSSGLVTGTARPAHIGRTTQVWHIDIRDDRDKLTCTSRITIAVLDNG